ncbi:hypothetical protein nbrc107696_44990 [Gordonia spumicola]|uniref:Uncharacterized protein n=1 Tax=Gordonia spumicola TaxID=589161 RepID=A0A7I9VG15_9ACTN|nr:hypothetical protein [Gordonia spumicola]GEE04053.1 hypothetical protein nbrc107696_44990 [Gordonia spumicola]
MRPAVAGRHDIRRLADACGRTAALDDHVTDVLHPVDPIRVRHGSPAMLWVRQGFPFTDD